MVTHGKQKEGVKTWANKQKKLQNNRKIKQYHGQEWYVECITYRDATTQEDLKVVYDAWCKSSSSHLHPDDFPKHNQEIGNKIKDLLQNGGSIVLAVNAGNEDQILGFVAFWDKDELKEPILEWIYTKAVFRNRGIMKQMLRLIGFSLQQPICINNYSLKFRHFDSKPYCFKYVGGKV